MKTEYFECEVQVVGFELLLFRENNRLASCCAPRLRLQAVCGLVIIHPPQSYSAIAAYTNYDLFFVHAV